MNEHRFRQLPVTGNDGELVGITNRDIRLHVVYMEDRLLTSGIPASKPSSKAL